MTILTSLTLPFEGEPLTTISWKGRPAWIARDIGRLLEYADDGRRIVSLIRREWADEFVEDRDFVVLQGEELAALKLALGTGPDGVPLRAAHLTLLLRPGLNLVLLKTNKEVGVKLREFLANEVLPQLFETGEYSPEPCVGTERVEVEAEVVVVERPLPTRPSMAERREARLARQALTRERWVDLSDRKLKVQTLHRATDRLRELYDLPAELVAELELTAVEIALGVQSLRTMRASSHLRPTRAPSALQIALAKVKLAELMSRLAARASRDAT